MAVAPAGAAPLVNENLLTKVPAIYKVGYTAHNQKLDFMELVPVPETVDDWTELVTIRVDHGSRVDPEHFQQAFATGWKRDCPGSNASRIAGGKEHGYPYSLWLYACPLNPKTQKPETTWVKAIEGNDSFYTVQYAYRKAPDASLAGPAMTFLNAAVVCDTRLADRKCPPGL